MTASVPLLEVENVAKSYRGVAAVRDTGLIVHERTIAGLIGPNGAGKTTVLNIVSGYAVPDSGASATAATTSPRAAHRNAPASGWCGRSRTAGCWRT